VRFSTEDLVKVLLLFAVWLVVSALLAFFIGGINPARLVARALGVDLAAEGSGNPGATNAGRVMGPRWGVLVGVLDVAKGWLPTVLVMRYAGGLAAWVAVFLVLGHVFSPYLRGRGGKGAATAFGTVLALRPWWALVLLGLFVLGALVLRKVAVGSMLASFALVVLGLAREQDGLIRFWAVAVGVIVLARHTENIKALLGRFGGALGPRS
jgi:glycerol-3-phosphate acyltransferase PlsY